MKKGIIAAGFLGLLVFAGCFHGGETKPTEKPAETPAAESTTK